MYSVFNLLRLPSSAGLKFETEIGSPSLIALKPFPVILVAKIISDLLFVYCSQFPIILSVSPCVLDDIGVVGYISAVSKKFIP